MRREYAWVDEGTFRSARRDVLAQFPARTTLYSTVALRERLELRARANLNASIARLHGAPVAPGTELTGSLTAPASRA